MHILKEPLLFRTLYGSKLYGTDGPASDTDVRGVFIPARDDLLLAKAPQHYVFKPDVQDHSPEHVDEQYLSLHYFLHLLTQGETNALDMFFSYTNSKALQASSPQYEELIANKDKLITKNVTKYLGYCRAQALKYSIKGDRIQNYEELLKLVDSIKDSSKTLEQVITEKVTPKMADPTPYEKNNKVIGKRFKFLDTEFGDHAYLVVFDNYERYFMLSGHLFPMNANMNSTRDSLNKCLASYGKRAFNAAEDNGADYKALSHALRVLFQADQLLRECEITFPLEETNLQIVRDVKFKTTKWSYNELVGMIEEGLHDIETIILPNSILPDKPDWDWINDFILRQYNG
jgi:hypothetical protein